MTSVFSWAFGQIDGLCLLRDLSAIDEIKKQVMGQQAVDLADIKNTWVKK
jgi:hypothetical protein